MPKTGIQVVIRNFREEDRSAVASLYEKVFGESALQAFMSRWSWQFDNNPACESLKSLMWVAELERDIVGFLASFPIRFKVFEKEAFIRFPCDLMVSTSARGRGVGEKLIRAYIDTEDLIINALGYSPASGRMFYRLGYREVDAERLGMRLCDLRPILRDSLTRHPIPRAVGALVPPLAGLLGGLLNVGLHAINSFRKPSHSDGVEIRRCTATDATFDGLWQRLSPAFPISAVRDRRWVQWRFLEDPLFEHDLFCASNPGGELLGYIDVRVSERRGLRFGRIIDLFCDPSSTDVAGSLLAAGAGHLEKKGVDVITSLGHLPGIQRTIAKYCYLTPGRLQTPALFIWKGDAELASAAYDAERWHLTHADGDDGFSP